ncbi:hypothetical protein ACQP3F_33765, partial [Escherichia coli]
VYFHSAYIDEWEEITISMPSAAILNLNKQANCRQTTGALCLCGTPRVSFRDSLPFPEAAFLRGKTTLPRGPRGRERGLDQP